MKKQFYIIRGLCLLMSLLIVISCTACRSAQDEQYDALVSAQKAANEEAQSAVSSQLEEQEEQSATEKQLSGELRISLPIENPVIEGWVSKFKKAYPDVSIKLEYAASDMDSISDDYATRYIQTTLAELANGEAADIIDLTPVSFYKYGKTGLFEDFNELMANDPDFDREDLYTNVLDALESADGKLYVLPSAFRFNPIVLNEYILYKMDVDADSEFADGVNYKSLTDLYWKAVEAGIIDESCYFAPKQNKFFFEGFCIPSFLDEKNGEARFDTPEFIEYLETTDALPFENTIEQGFTYDPNMPRFGARDAFCQSAFFLPAHLNALLDAPPTGCTKGFLYKDENGNVPFATSNHLAIPKGGNVELAWEFIQFMIAEREFPDQIDIYDNPEDIQNYVQPYSSGIPINRQNCLGMYAAIFDDTVAQRADQYAQMFNIRSGNSTELMENLQDIFISYYDHHLITAEECAKQLQERAWIYLNE